MSIGPAAADVTIKRITAHPLRYPEPHDHGAIRHVTLARVEADDGAVGWGECISQFPESCRAAKVIIEEGYAPLLVGMSPLEVEACWHRMHDRTWWYGPQGSAAFALSAVDMALSPTAWWRWARSTSTWTTSTGRWTSSGSWPTPAIRS